MLNDPGLTLIDGDILPEKACVKVEMHVPAVVKIQTHLQIHFIICLILHAQCDVIPIFDI